MVDQIENTSILSNCYLWSEISPCEHISSLIPNPLFSNQNYSNLMLSSLNSRLQSFRNQDYPLVSNVRNSNCFINSRPIHFTRNKIENSNDSSDVNIIDISKSNTKSIYIQNLNYPSNNMTSLFLNNIQLKWAALNNQSSFNSNFSNRDGCIFALEFDDNAEHMAASNHMNTIEIWDIRNKRIKKILTHHQEIVTGIEYFPGDKEFMMTCSLDKTIRIWKNYNLLRTFDDHSDWIRSIGISKSKSFFLSGCISSMVKHWDLNTGKVNLSIVNLNENDDALNTVNSLRFMNSNDNIFITGLRDGFIKMIDTRDRKLVVQNFRAHVSKLNSIKFNRTDRYILSCGRDSLGLLWDTRNLPFNKLSFLSSGDCNNTVTTKNSTVGVDVKENQFKAVSKFDSHICNGYNIECSFYAREECVITGSEDYGIYIYNISDGRLMKRYTTNTKCINLVKPLPEKSSKFGFAFTSLEDVSLYLCDTSIASDINTYRLRNNTKNLKVNDSNEASRKANFLGLENNIQEDESERVQREIREMMNKFLEELMKENGDQILKIIHSNNMVYSNDLNFERILDLIKSQNTPEALELHSKLNRKFHSKIVEMHRQLFLKKSSKEPQHNKPNHGKETTTEGKNENKNKIEIKCLYCQDYETFLQYAAKTPGNQSNNEFKQIDNSSEEMTLKSHHSKSISDQMKLPNKIGLKILREVE